MENFAETKSKKRTIQLANGKVIGEDNFLIIAGPCAVEGEQQLKTIAKQIANTYNIVLRGGVFKPRTSPHDFQGLGLEGASLLSKIGKQFNLLTITEVTDPRQIEPLEHLIDIYQIGSRNMHNYSLLKEIGKSNKPIVLKRGMAATISEWLLAAAYIELEGNDKIILCERGIRTFETYTRNTLDLSSILAVKAESKYPVIVDPSHATGRREMVIPLAKAALAVGADGIMVEVHNNPEHALCDGQQSLSLKDYKLFISELSMLAEAMGKNCGFENMEERNNE